MEINYITEKPGKISPSRKQQILSKATQMFREKGYVSSSVRDLAQEVGIEASSIYSHFKSKEDILRYICFEMAHAFIQGLERAEVKKDAKEQLRSAIEEHFKVVMKNREASAVMWHEWKYLSDQPYQEFQDLKLNYEERFENIISVGIKSGVFRNCSTKIVSNLILSSLNSLAYWHKDAMISIDESKEELEKIYLTGILK